MDDWRTPAGHRRGAGRNTATAGRCSRTPRWVHQHCKWASRGCSSECRHDKARVQNTALTLVPHDLLQTTVCTDGVLGCTQHDGREINCSGPGGAIGFPFRYRHDKSHIKLHACMKPFRHAEAPPATGAYFTRAFGRGVIMQGGGYTGDVTVTEAYFTRALSRGAIM